MAKTIQMSKTTQQSKTTHNAELRDNLNITDNPYDIHIDFWSCYLLSCYISIDSLAFDYIAISDYSILVSFIAILDLFVFIA